MRRIFFLMLLLLSGCDDSGRDELENIVEEESQEDTLGASTVYAEVFLNHK